MRKSRASVVIPSFNYGRFLEDAVRSVWMQTVPAAQIIVSDDGSKDDSVAVARRLAAISPVPLLVIASDHVGLHASLNRSLHACTEDVVAFLAADDRWTPDFLAQQLTHFENSTEVVLAHCDFSLIDAEGRPLPVPATSNRPADGRCLEALLRGTATMRTGPVVRREVALSFGGFDPTYPQEDWSFYLRCASRGPIGYSGHRLVERRIHGANASVRSGGALNWEHALKAAAVPLLEELSPTHEVMLDALAFHLGVLVRSSLYAGEFEAAAEVVVSAARQHPELARPLVLSAVRGLASFAWSRTGRQLLSGRRLSAAEAIMRRLAGL